MLSTAGMIESLRTFFDLLVPELCPGCSLVSDGGFCGQCRATFARVIDPCARCGLPRPVFDCPAGRSEWSLDAVRAPFVYAPPLRLHLQTLKFGGRRSIGRALGLLLAERLASGPLEVDAIVAVPLNGHRLRERGFNQADEIARPIARRLAIPQIVSRIARPKPTRPQTDLAPAARRRNLADAFAVRRDLANARIAIVDDVMTTAATGNALAAALRSAGARRVEAWTVARALGRERVLVNR